ncbi:MAG: alanine--glyoxylate aminotransferase family protein [Anaerolineales bacterium]
MNLRVPGPTPLPPAVRKAMAEPMIGHRGSEFQRLMAEIRSPLRAAFGTAGDVLVLTASGTGGLEAAVVNTLSPGDKVVAVSVGVFGRRFAAIAEAFGAQVTLVEFPPGQPADAGAVEAALQAVPDAKALLLTHNETSTGVVNDVPTLVRAARGVSPDVLVLVDGVSSVGAMPMRADEWGCDVVVAASQKGLMGPPGLALISVSPRGWAAVEQARMPRFYWDLREARRWADRNETPFTPAVGALRGLHAGLCLLMAEGLDAAFARHRRLARMARRGLARLGFRLVAEEACASPSVTAAWVPDGVSAGPLIRVLAERYKVVLTQGHEPDRTIRVAHMGWVDEADIHGALAAVESALADVKEGRDANPDYRSPIA